MRKWMLGLTFMTVLAAGCSGADQNSSSNGGAGGSGTTTTKTGGAGGSTGGANTGGSTGGTGGCQLITEDASKIGASCENGVACPTGYTCHEFNGITVTHNCAILCDQDCQCPQDTLCVMRSDKATSWKECVKP